jgi:hypothetical protein
MSATPTDRNKPTRPHPPREGDTPRYNPDHHERASIDSQFFADESSVRDFRPTEADCRAVRRSIGRGEPGIDEAGGIDSLLPCEWDTCAWYQDEHRHPRDWGIYIEEECVKQSAKKLARFIKAPPEPMDPSELFNRLCKEALLALYYHEYYHYRVEQLGYRLEEHTGRDCYVPYSEKVYSVLKENAEKFPAGPYKENWDPDEQIEESLANAYSYSKMGLRQRLRGKVSTSFADAACRAMLWQFKFEPPGYRLALRYLTPARFLKGENLLKHRVYRADLVSAKEAESRELPDVSADGGQAKPVEVWLVNDRSAGKTSVTPVVEDLTAGLGPA